MSNPDFADSRLADAIWWFHGFNAAVQPSANDFTETPVSVDLASGLRGVRAWLIGLAKGRTRLIGTTERDLAGVLTEHELEVIHDGLRVTAEPSERDAAREIVAKVLKQIGLEYREMMQGEVPF